MLIRTRTDRRGERGQTIALLAISLVSLLGLAALAIDVSALYVAKGEAQRAADAAALAGARMFAASSFASTPNSFGVSGQVCSNGAGSSAAVNKQAVAAAAQNSIANQPATVTDITCDLSQDGNPRVTVEVSRNNLTTFFSRIWTSAVISTRATAIAEAYNASGQPVPVQVTGAKPWLLANCDQFNTTGTLNPNCPGYSVFVKADGTLENNGAFIGETIPLAKLRNTGTPTADSFYALNFPTPATSCPRFGGDCVQDGAYRDDVQCSSPVKLSCGDTVGPGTIPVIGVAGYGTPTREATQCLIHATAPDSLTAGQDEFFPNAGKAPVTIRGGGSNPNPPLIGIDNLSRSDSIVTVPLFNGANLCPGGSCVGSTTIVGFMQLGIRRACSAGGGSCLPAAGGANPHLEAVILNAVGCSANGNGVSGTSNSPITVRLIHQ